MKLIFLDFDGVMNSERYFDSITFQTETKGMDWDEIMLIAHHTHLDRDAIQLINQLVDRSEASVIVSSTWRQHYTIDELNKMLKNRGATFNIIAPTPVHRSGYVSWGMSNVIRGKEIQEYLDEIEKPVQFVILDDIDNMTHLSDHLVLTNEDVGITQEDIEKALKILSEE
jgi:HAD domain in Swiss Army Knife RNA repair proteins